ncbi:MAG: type II CAAX endopeptidase family protein [Anaerovoracaceae bacterium]
MKKLNSHELPYGQWSWWFVPIALFLSVPLIMGLTIVLGQTPLRQISQVLAYFVAALITVGIGSLIKRKNCFVGFSFLGKGKLIQNLLWGVAIGVLIIWTTRGVEFLLSNKDTGVNSLVEMSYGKAIGGTIVTTLLITTLAPVMEELFFRAILFRSLRDSLGRFVQKRGKSKVVVEVISFALAMAIFIGAHLTESDKLKTALLYLPMTFLFIWVYRHTGSLLAAITAHAVNNSNAMFTSILALNKDQNYDPVSEWYILLSIVGGIVAIALGYLLGRLLDEKKHSRKRMQGLG